MQVNGHLDFGGVGKLLRPVLADSDFPPDPGVGEILFKNRRVYICVEVEDGLPFWVQLTQELNTYRHTQDVPALEWVINHKLNTNVTNAQAYDTEGKQILPDEIDSHLVDTTVMKFNIPMAGVALLMMGDMMGLPKDNIGHIQSFTNESVWVVVHGLGFNPSITCIIGGYVVQPKSIVHDSTMQATVTFTNPQTGSVRCV